MFFLQLPQCQHSLVSFILAKILCPQDWACVWTHNTGLPVQINCDGFTWVRCYCDLQLLTWTWKLSTDYFAVFKNLTSINKIKHHKSNGNFLTCLTVQHPQQTSWLDVNLWMFSNSRMDFCLPQCIHLLRGLRNHPVKEFHYHPPHLAHVFEVYQ